MTLITKAWFKPAIANPTTTAVSFHDIDYKGLVQTLPAIGITTFIKIIFKELSLKKILIEYFLEEINANPNVKL